MLSLRGVHRPMIAAMRAPFDENTSRVGLMGVTSRTIAQPMGLLQGSILSPILYASFVDGLANRIRNVSRLWLGDHRMRLLLCR